jgi:hypothetical protein
MRRAYSRVLHGTVNYDIEADLFREQTAVSQPIQQLVWIILQDSLDVAGGLLLPVFILEIKPLRKRALMRSSHGIGVCNGLKVLFFRDILPI